MPKRSAPTPEPVPVNVVCSLCGEAWSLHAEIDGEVSTLECIRLLKAKARANLPPRPMYPTYPNPVFPHYGQPYWVTYTSGTISVSSGVVTGTSGATAINCTVRTPTIALASAS